MTNDELKKKRESRISWLRLCYYGGFFVLFAIILFFVFYWGGSNEWLAGRREYNEASYIFDVVVAFVTLVLVPFVLNLTSWDGVRNFILVGEERGMVRYSAVCMVRMALPWFWTVLNTVVYMMDDSKTSSLSCAVICGLLYLTTRPSAARWERETTPFSDN